MQTRWPWRALIVGAVVFFGGPILGVILFMVTFGMIELVEGPDSLLRRLHGVMISPLLGLAVAPFAFVIVGPGAIAAAAATATVVFRHGHVSYLASALIGALAMLVWTPFWALRIGDLATVTWSRFALALESGASPILVFVSLGAIVAVILRWMTGRFGLFATPPDRSVSNLSEGKPRGSERRQPP